MIAQSVGWKSVDIPVQTDFYVAGFHTDNYRTRIFSYEKNILYAFNMPSFYGKGVRLALSLDVYKRQLLLVFPDNQGNGLIRIVCRLRNRDQPGKRLHIQSKTAEIGLLPVRTLVAIPRSGTWIPIGFRRKQHIIGCLETIFLIKLKHFLIIRLL